MIFVVLAALAAFAPVFGELGARASSWSFPEILKAVLIVGGCIAVFFIVCKAMGWTVPQWFVQIVVVCAVVAIGIIAINFLVSL